MIIACRLHDTRAGCGIRIAFRSSDPVRSSSGSSVIRTPASSRSSGGQKNRLRNLRPGAAWLVRPQTAPGARSRLRRPAHLPRARGATRGLSALRHGEAGTPRLPGRQSVLHQALRLLRGAPLSGLADPGRGQRAAPRLAHREGVGAAVHARAIAARRGARPAGHRDRRGLDPQGAHLPHCRQRSHPAPSDLVRRDGSLRGEPGSVLRLARPAQGGPSAARRHGHVETLPALDRAPRPAGQHPVRQVPYPAPPGRRPRSGPQDGRRALKTLLAANKRLNTAYVLKESFGQLWSYEREGWARRFFENWRASLKWQRLEPYEKFAAMIDRHWDGIAAYCRPENKVALGFV